MSGDTDPNQTRIEQLQTQIHQYGNLCNSQHDTTLYDKLKARLKSVNVTDNTPKFKSIDELQQYANKHTPPSVHSISIFDPLLLKQCILCHRQVLESIYDTHYTACQKHKQDLDAATNKQLQSVVIPVNIVDTKQSTTDTALKRKRQDSDHTKNKPVNGITVDINDENDSNKNKQPSPTKRIAPVKTLPVPSQHNNFTTSTVEYATHNRLLQRMLSYIPQYYRNSVTTQLSCIREMLFCTSIAPIGVSPLIKPPQPTTPNKVNTSNANPHKSPVNKTKDLASPAGSTTSASPHTAAKQNGINDNVHRAALMLPPQSPVTSNNTNMTFNSTNTVNTTNKPVKPQRKPRVSKPKQTNGTPPKSTAKTKRQHSDDSASIDVSSPISVNTQLTPNGNLTPVTPNGMLAYPAKQMPTSAQPLPNAYHNPKDRMPNNDLMHTQHGHSIYDSNNVNMQHPQQAQIQQQQQQQRNQYQPHPQQSPPHQQRPVNYQQSPIAVQQHQQPPVQQHPSQQQQQRVNPQQYTQQPQQQHQRHPSGYSTMSDITAAARTSNNSNAAPHYKNTSIDWSTLNTPNNSLPLNNYQPTYNNNVPINNHIPTNHTHNIPQNNMYSNAVKHQNRTISDNMHISQHQQPLMRTGSAELLQQHVSPPQHNRMQHNMSIQQQQAQPQQMRQMSNQVNYQQPMPVQQQQQQMNMQQQQQQHRMQQQQQYQQQQQQQLPQQRYQPPPPIQQY